VKVPRDLSGVALAKALSKVGYQVTRQTGSHIRLTTQSPTLMSARANTPEGERLDVLARLVEAYEKKHVRFPVEVYSEGRIGEFDEAEADLEKILTQRKKTAR